MRINNFDELITSDSETRAGFISFALEKNRRSTPFINDAKYLRIEASKATTPTDLIDMENIRKLLLTASGLSDKALAYFSEENKNEAILNLITNFLEPAGSAFVDEVVFRFLLIRGDTLGGTMRNIIGALAEQKLKRNLLTIMNAQEISYRYLSKESKKKWISKPYHDYGIEDDMKAITWENNSKHRLLIFNRKLKLIDKNVDICLYDYENLNNIEEKINIDEINGALMFGELKGGIDPAGADEHWKTANIALRRIREKCRKEVLTSFIGAAIQPGMAKEIFQQYQSGELSFAANLTKDEQLFSYNEWILSL